MAWVTFYKAVIHYHDHFFLTIITHVGGPNGVNMGPMQHWLLHSLTKATPFKSQKILFKTRALGSNLLQPKGDQVYLTFQY